MISVGFVLLREGVSDDGLIPHLEKLLLRAGVDEVFGSGRDYRGTVVEKVQQVLDEHAAVDIIFVHRDADSPDPSQRRLEVAGACEQLDFQTAVAVVPVQELEAWLLLDEMEIRRVVGRPSGRADLGLPKLGRVEQTSSPKEILKQSLLRASETTGRRHRVESGKFSLRRQMLLERLDIDGQVRRLSAWKALEADVARVVSLLADPPKHAG